MLRALTRTYSLLPRAGIRGGLVASVHDELLLEVHEDDTGTARALLEQAITDAFVETFPEAPTANLVTAEIGRYWQETKP
jgi:DNA polymerase I-like protein with 3'-5' exonuclease and polymerase domains